MVPIEQHARFRSISARRNIDAFIAQFGYEMYARNNVMLAKSSIATGNSAVVALSSCFLLYGEDAAEWYVKLRDDMIASPHSFLLLP